MNLIFIYGPPATGKLTVAQELSTLTGYAIFHNHVTRDLVQNIYPTNLAEHYDLVETLREDVLGYCAAHNTSVIFTMVYDGPEDDQVVADRVSAVTAHGGSVYFVELTAPRDVLLERVANQSRTLHKKLVDPAKLTMLLDTTPYTSVPYDDIFKLDTAELQPAQAAVEIARHFKLN